MKIGIPFINVILQKEFFQNILKLTTGTTISQVIPLLAMPLLTRLYAPEDFGNFALFMAIHSFLAVLATGQFESAIILPKKEFSAVNIAGLSILISLAVSIFVFLILVFLDTSYIFGLDIGEINKWYYFLPFLLIVTSIFRNVEYLILRTKNYNVLSTSKIIEETGNSGFKIGFGFLRLEAFGLIAGAILGLSLSTWILVKSYLNNNKHYIKYFRLKHLLKYFGKYNDFIKYSMPQSMLNFLNYNLIIFAISYYYDMAVLGLFSFALSVLRRPTMVLGNSISRVFYQRSSELLNDGQTIQFFTRKTMLLLFIISITLFSVIFFWGPPIFGLVFGEQWIEAGLIARILAPWLMIRLVISPLSVIPKLLNKQKVFFTIETIKNILMPGTLILFAILRYDYQISLMVLSLMGFITTLYLLFWIYNLTKLKVASV